MASASIGLGHEARPLPAPNASILKLRRLMRVLKSVLDLGGGGDRDADIGSY